MHDLWDDITRFIFLNDAPEKSDIIFIPGNGHPEPSEHAARLWAQGLAPLIMPSGRYSVTAGKFSGQLSGTRSYPGDFQTEAEFMKSILNLNGVPDEAILREDQSTFTYQNSLCCRKKLEEQSLVIRKAIICCMPVHARRCFMYFQAVFPNTEFFVCPADSCQLTSDNWRASSEGILQVLGELERCGNQFRDILLEKQVLPHSGFPSPLEERFLPDTTKNS